MARPRKDSLEPDARERIIAAFWELIQEHDIHDLSASVIAERAQCNRGTFYYHFNGVDDLVMSVFEDEIFMPTNLSTVILNVLTETEDAAESMRLEEGFMRKVALLVSHGGFSLLHGKVKHLAFDLWQSVLCPNGEELTPQARSIISYAVGGIMGFLLVWDEGDYEDENPAGLWVQLGSVLLNELSRAQGVPAEEILMRLKMMKMYLQLQSA